MNFLMIEIYMIGFDNSLLTEVFFSKLFSKIVSILIGLCGFFSDAYLYPSNLTIDHKIKVHQCGKLSIKYTLQFWDLLHGLTLFKSESNICFNYHDFILTSWCLIFLLTLQFILIN